MKIFEYSNNPREYPHNFEYIFKIYVENDKELVLGGGDLIDSLGYWLQENTEDNYIFLRLDSILLGGGYGGNSKQSYVLVKGHEKDPFNGKLFDHLEIRMSKNDAVKFKLRWG